MTPTPPSTGAPFALLTLSPEHLQGLAQILAPILSQELAQRMSTPPSECEAPTPTQGKRYKTRKEVCEIFNVSPSTLTNWKRRGILTPYKVVGRSLYREEDIDKLIRQSKQRPALRVRTDQRITTPTTNG